MKTLFFILFLAPFVLPAQSTEPILTKEQNAEWITALEQQDLPGRLEMLKKRWKADTEVHYQVSVSPHRPASASNVETKCRPLYFLRSEGEKQVILSANPTKDAIDEASKMMNTNNISEVKIETGIKMNALYGASASCGVIFITVPEKAIFDRLASEVNQ